VVHSEEQEEAGVEMRSEKFARATQRSVTDMCQNVSSTKYFVVGPQTYKSALLPIKKHFDLCAESGNVFGPNMLFEPTAVVSRLPRTSKVFVTPSSPLSKCEFDLI
jgi:hypothetical protein